MTWLPRVRELFVYTLCVGLVACSNGSGSLEEPTPSPSTPPPEAPAPQQPTQPPPPTSPSQSTFTVGGSVSGLAGDDVVLLLNGGNELSVAADGAFTFNSALPTGATYIVTVLTHPSTPVQTCSIVDANGTIADTNVTSVAVTCATGQFRIGGTVSGLTGTGLVLQNNGGDPLPVTANGPFTFAGPVASGGAYNVTVRSQPAGQNCAVAAPASGTIANASITNLRVTCSATSFAIAGKVTGLRGTGLILQLNKTNDLAISADGDFAFPVMLARNTPYEVRVKPNTKVLTPSQTCRVTNDKGTVTAAVTNVRVACTTDTFAISGRVDGLEAQGQITLKLNGANDVGITSNGQFTFEPRIASGQPYTVTIARQPANGQNCTVANGSGIVGNTRVTGISITCSRTEFNVGGAVTGLAAGQSIALLNNGGNALTVAANGGFTFPQRVSNGGGYNVTIGTPPANQTCTVTNGAGTIQGAHVSNVAVRCATNEVTLGGSVAGLVGSGLVLRNGAEDLPIAADGPFTFRTPLPFGTPYNVSIAAPPSAPAQTCAVENPSGTAGATNITNVRVVCSGPATYTVGGQVHMLFGSGLQLQINGGEAVPVASNGGFTFPTPLPSGSPYTVTVLAQPASPDQVCEVENGSGTIGDSNVGNIQVRCGLVLFP